jgi:hypothetical protein
MTTSAPHPTHPAHGPQDALGESRPPAHAAAPVQGQGSGAAAWLTLALPTLPEPTGVRQRLGAKLAQRVASSAAANRSMHTVRAKRAGLPVADWHTIAPGVRARVLHPAGTLVSPVLSPAASATSPAALLLELAPGAQLALTQLPPPWRADGQHVHEWLLLHGHAALDDVTLAPEGYALFGTDQTPRQLCALGTAPAQLYLQALPAHKGLFGAVQGRHSLAADAPGWQPLRPGVSIKPLYAGGQGCSLLARFEPGARVPAHPHGVDEVCLMLQGELFLGDVLLCEGDFQFAPHGSAHGDLFADSPCLLFFHGAIDPAAVDVAYRAAAGWPS